MNNQLSSLSTQYRKFSKGQRVDHIQFNEFLDFFEDQDRLSRVMLQGVGIVCGFQPKLNYTNNKISSIVVSQGIAITTDGDLLTLNSKSKAKNVSTDSYMSELKTIDFDGKQYTHWKAYDNNKAMYPAFHTGSGNQVAQIDLWELAPAIDAKKGFQPLTDFSGLEDKYLLLYLEAYEKEVRPCVGVDCDNHGIQQIRNLKVLVTTASGINQILKSDKVSPHPLSLNLIGEEKLKRVILQPVQSSVTILRDGFSNVVAQSSYSTLFNNIDRVCNILGIPLINRATFSTRLNSLSAQTYNFQYTYGVLKDITDTYSEIVKLFSKTFTKYLPDLQSFPKHIMLGKIVPGTNFDTTRHQFYNSPVLDSEKMHYERLKLLIGRFNELTLRFRDPSEVAAKNGIKITPSQYISALGTKAIPFYYEVTESLLDVWNFDNARNRTSNTNLSFSTTLLSSRAHIQDPLGYNIDRKPFYRIEGHQGIDYSTAVTQIRQIKDADQLGFDVMALSLTQIKDNKDISKAYFTDYIDKHPGLEHLGGVKRGGTFVLVYESEINRTVIADFAIPYICCTPKSDVSLTLPVSTICESASSVIFRVTPANGVVKANVKAGYTGGVQSVNGQYVFNPQLVEDDLINTDISFTVNGKQTNCTVKVLPLSGVSFSASEFAYPEGSSSKTTVTFNISGENFADYDYQWDFLGNQSYVPQKPDTKGNVKYDYFKIDAKKPVNMLVSGKGCSEVKTITDWYVPPKQTLGVTITASATVLDPKTILKLSSVVTGGSNSLLYSWTSDPENLIIDNKEASQINVTFRTEGNYKFTVKVIDTNTNSTAQAVVNIVVKATQV